VLGVGIDWAEEFHLIALGRPDEGVIETRRVDHSRAGVGALLRHIAKLEPDAAAVRVVIEARHGLLVEALVDAGFTVVPVNPELVARRRGPWIATPRSSRWSPTVSWPPSYARSPATTNAPPGTRPGC
jgi:hypothetical protein